MDSATGMAGPIIRVHPHGYRGFGVDNADVDPHLATPNIRNVT